MHLHLLLLLQLALALLRLRLLQALLLQLRGRGLRRGGARELLLRRRRQRRRLVLRAVGRRANVGDGHLWLVRGGAVGGERGHVEDGRREAVAVVVLHGGRGSAEKKKT